jgi:hypothetical protein
MEYAAIVYNVESEIGRLSDGLQNQLTEIIT